MSDGGFFPTEKVLSYFYLSLYEKQHKGFQDYPWSTCFSDSDFCKNPDELYQALTEVEKTRADRMLARISQ